MSNMIATVVPYFIPIFSGGGGSTGNLPWYVCIFITPILAAIAGLCLWFTHEVWDSSDPIPSTILAFIFVPFAMLMLLCSVTVWFS